MFCLLGVGHGATVALPSEGVLLIGTDVETPVLGAGTGAPVSNTGLELCLFDKRFGQLISSRTEIERSRLTLPAAGTVRLNEKSSKGTPMPTLLTSTLTCPLCGHRALEAMPTDACQVVYECRGCGTLLRPKTGDCCVFCSYGDIPCPPIQESPRGTRVRMLRRGPPRPTKSRWTLEALRPGPAESEQSLTFQLLEPLA